MAGELNPVLVGWHVDPGDPDRLRYFDGYGWTDRMSSRGDGEGVPRSPLRPAARYWAEFTGVSPSPSTTTFDWSDVGGSVATPAPPIAVHAYPASYVPEPYAGPGGAHPMPGYPYPGAYPFTTPATVAPWGGQPEPGRPASRWVQGLGRAAQLVLAVQILAALYAITVLLHQRSLISQIVGHPGSVSLSDATASDNAVRGARLLAGGLDILSGVVFVVWFYRARRNVDRWGARNQRHARGWAIGGWICPVVNLWFPYAIANDIFLDSTDTAPRGLGGRPRCPLLRFWWFCFLLGNATLYLSLRVSAHTAGEFANQDLGQIAGYAVQAVALVSAILVVGAITSAQMSRITWTTR